MVVFHALTLKLPIQTSLSVAHKLQVCVRSGENVKNSGKQAHPRQTQNSFLEEKDAVVALNASDVHLQSFTKKESDFFDLWIRRATGEI